jgi:hypothetical protein
MGRILLDNQLIALVISTLISGEATAGIPGTPVKQAFQPTLQGVNTQPTAYLYKICDRRYGYLMRQNVWDTVNSVMVHTESQQYETIFQISALATQNPNTPNQYTASDICNLCAAILQSDQAIQTFQTNGVGIERITEVRNPYFLDDRQQNEACPSFDVTFCHKQTIVSTTPIIQSTEFQLFTV